MEKQIILALLLLFLSWINPVLGNKEQQFNETLIEDAQTVSAAVENIRKVLEDQGFDIIGVVNHTAGAENIGLELRPTQVILFSNGLQEKLLIRRNQTLAIDLPQKILVWKDEGGFIRIFYNEPGYLIDRHHIRSRDVQLSRISRTLNQFGGLDNGLITIDSPFSVDETVENLTNVIKNLADRGFRIPFVIDFKAKETGRLRPTTLIIFGNPNVGTPLMQNQQQMGVDLPQKFLVWEDEEGQVYITYNDILFLAKRHGLQNVDPNLESITNALANFAKAATIE